MVEWRGGGGDGEHKQNVRRTASCACGRSLMRRRVSMCVRACVCMWKERASTPLNGDNERPTERVVATECVCNRVRETERV